MEEQAAGTGFALQKPRRRARPREEKVPALRLRASRRAVARARVETPPASFLRPLLDFLGEAGVDPDDLRNRDPEFIRAVVPWLDTVTKPYFRPEYEGGEHLPRSGPFIAVGNHNGGPVLPDLWTMLPFWAETVGTDLPVYAMVHDVAFKVKVAGNFFARLGGLRACRRNAEKVLAAGAGLLVYPGGSSTATGASGARHDRPPGPHRLRRLAFEHGAPIIPFVNVGAHETCLTLFSSRTLARWTASSA
jgi:1-acyl-sn-glycerol-3-phosphate acyltransferase